MSLYATLEEAIEAAREEFIETAEGGDDEPPVPQQFNLQNTSCWMATRCGRRSFRRRR